MLRGFQTHQFANYAKQGFDWPSNHFVLLMREFDAARMSADAFCSESLGLFEEEIIE
jgi:hypothetical protein